MDKEKEVQQLKNRIKDLADKSYRQNMYTFTGFLGLAEQTCFWQMEKDLWSQCFEFWGGYEEAERKLLRFGSEIELGYVEEFPIKCIHIKPLLLKFADELSHRDFLGALMNLGIDRSTIGDIRIKGKEAYLLCLDSIAEYICLHLDKIKHTNVKCTIVDRVENIQEEVPESENVLVPSLRTDVCLSKIYGISRTEVLNMFRSGKVFLNGRLCENNSKILKEKDVVNLRGYGKFIYQQVAYETKKGKISIEIKKYK